MSLKDALEKAGIKTKKSENHRKYKPKKELAKVERHQETRIFCEVCETTQQDVERYKHKNRLIDAEWICVNCADKNSIHDDFRLTEQSIAAKNRSFKRFYGPTKDFSKEKVITGKPNNNLRAGFQNNKRPQRDERERKKKYIIDEKGEKNFNC